MSTTSTASVPEQEYKVTPLELFFDLVFVFAISQLSHHLLDHLSWRGALETAVLLLPIITVWTHTSWAATIICAEYSKTRWMLLLVMLLGLFMNASATRAFTSSGWAFVIPLLLIHLGRTAWTIINAPDASYRRHYFRVLAWFILTTPFWIAGACTTEFRLLWWLLAAGLEQTGTGVAHQLPGRKLHSEGFAFDADHMLERCQLFLIIALGETVFTIGTAIAGAPMSMMTLTTGTIALAGTVALWSLSFGRAHSMIEHHIAQTNDPVHASRHAVNAMMPLVGGLIAVAVANEMAIADPHQHTTLALSLLLTGGALLFLVGQGWYLRTVLNASSRLQRGGSIALLVMGLAGLFFPAFIALILVEATLVALAIVDRYSRASI